MTLAALRRCYFVLIAQGFHFLFSQLFWLARQGCAFKQHGLNFFVQGSRASPFDTPHFCIKFPLQGIFKRLDSMLFVT
jgi:hypothetical protein